jgi:hypothetical protein
MKTRTIAAAALAAGMLFQALGFAQDAVGSASSSARAPKAADPEAMAREIWRSSVVKNPAPGKGCFHLSYPNYLWEQTECDQTPTGFQPRAGAPAATEGARGDYAANSTGLIYFVRGVFVTSGVESVASVGGMANEGGVPILGPNEYSLQINTNSQDSTAACDKQTSCTVWQQFMYATDYYGPGKAGLIIQYWLQHWTGTCPTQDGWRTQRTPNDTGTETSCYRNSNPKFLPDIPIAELGNVTMNAYATPGGSDSLMLTYSTDDHIEAWQVSDEDSDPLGVDIASVWRTAEFNVFGDMEFAEAVFNTGSSITLQLNLDDGTPICSPPGSGTTGETNNLNLGPCQTGASYIEFTESLPWQPLAVVSPIEGTAPVGGTAP